MTYPGEKEFRQAVSLFERFHDRDPRNGEITTIDLSDPVEVLSVGHLEGIMYSVAGEKTPYFHRISKKIARPQLFVSSDGKQTFLFGGTVKFTPRGFME